MSDVNGWVWQTIWSNGSRTDQAMHYTAWLIAQPDNGGGVECCLEMYQGSTWNDRVCSNTENFLCEIEL